MKDLYKKLEEIEQLEKAATPEPWFAKEKFGVCDEKNHIVDCGHLNDADFIAAARTAIPWLTSTLRQVIKERDAAVDDCPGLKVKYHVFKAGTWEPVKNCFVLRPDKDLAARSALYEYANQIEPINDVLANDLQNWIDKMDNIDQGKPESEV